MAIDRLATLNSILDGQLTQLLAVVQAGPKVTYNIRGKQYDWIEWQTMIQTQIDVTREQIARFEGPGVEYITGEA